MNTQLEIDTYRLPSLHEIEAPQRFDELEAILEKAEKEGVIPLLPNVEQDVRYRDLHESRIRTIRTRLYLLGYLARDSLSSEIDDKLKEAIGRFQKEAGLKQDKWVGIKTWTALQEIVSFEHPTNIENWIENDKINPAFLRAIRLRLFVLGFLPSKQTKNEKELKRAIERFVLVAKILKLHEKPLPPGLQLVTIKVLFDQDHIVERLAKAGETFMMHRPADLSNKKAALAVKKFIICCAKIELWLLGYDVPLDGKAKFEVPRSTRKTYEAEDYPLYHALYSFWRGSGRPKRTARRLANHITGHLFDELLRVQQGGQSSLDPNRSEKLYEMLSKAKESVLDQVWGHVKSIGSRIWDGIKRVWRWFQSLFNRLINNLTKWVKNVARLVYRYALTTFPILKRIVRITKETVSFLTHKTLQGSDINHIVINRDRDFDYRIYMNMRCDRERTETILAEFLKRAHLFSKGMRLLAHFLSAIITLMTSVAKAGGWFGLILALVKIYSRLKEIGEVLGEDEAFLTIV